MKIGKNIFTYWHQGFHNAPAVVRLCVHSLCRHHTSWDIHLLDSESVQQWLDPIPIPSHRWRRLPMAHQSDIIRTQLLMKYGGVWVDPTVYFTGSLDDWLGKQMESGVFFFHRPGRDRIISNWFIASQPANPLIIELYQQLCRYWAVHDFHSIGFCSGWSIALISRLLHRNMLGPQLWLTPTFIALFRHAPYMIYHYLFAYLNRKDAAFSTIWKKTPKVSSDAPHRLLRHGLFETISSEISNWLESGEPPLFKLTWKLDVDTLRPDSVLTELFHREGFDVNELFHNGQGVIYDSTAE